MKTINTNKHFTINNIDTIAAVQLYAADYAICATVVCRSRDGKVARYEVGSLYDIDMVRTCQDVATVLLVGATAGEALLNDEVEALAYQTALQLLAGSNLDADETAFNVIDLLD